MQHTIQLIIGLKVQFEIKSGMKDLQVSFGFWINVLYSFKFDLVFGSYSQFQFAV